MKRLMLLIVLSLLSGCFNQPQADNQAFLDWKFVWRPLEFIDD